MFNYTIYLLTKYHEDDADKGNKRVRIYLKVSHDSK